jgi:hypothetical protein
LITLGKTEVTVPLATRTQIKGTSKNFPANLTNYWRKHICGALGTAVALVIELGGDCHAFTRRKRAAVPHRTRDADG